MSTALFIVIGAAAALFLGFLIVVVVWQIRTRRFRPNPDKNAQQEQLNQDLEPVGFAYDRRTDTFYSLMDCWQRKMCYCRLYDEAAPGFNMIMHCEPVPFFYGGKRWLVELWKGQYGITTGGEIGVYNTTLEDVHSEKFIGTFYESISDDERLPMAFVLRKNGKPIMRRKGLHWWLTGFKLGEFSPTHTLTMDARITFPDKAMCRAFADSLRGIGYQPHEFSVRGRTAVVHYTTPHTPQSLNVVQEAVIQQANENNCGLYRMATAKYSDTLDKLEYVKAAMPELYEFFLHSLYARGLFEAFEWLIDLVHPPHPQPCPPEPCPPDPEPPCPPRPRPCPVECLLIRPVPGEPGSLLACPVPCPPEPESPCPPPWPLPCPPQPCPPSPPCPPEPKPPCPCCGSRHCRRRGSCGRSGGHRPEG